MRPREFDDGEGFPAAPSDPDDWTNRLYWLGGVNQNCRWAGECRCGFATGALGFQSASDDLRRHIAANSCGRYPG